MLSRRGHLRRPAAGALALTAVLAAATACGSSGSSDAAGSKPPTVSVSASPSASATSAAPRHSAGLRTGYPRQQLQFSRLPHARGPVRAALASYLTFESLVRGSFRSAHVPARLGDYASDPVLNTFESSARAMQRRSIHFEGPTDVAVTSAQGNDDIVALGLCLDTSRTRQVVEGRVEPLDGPPRARVRVVLTNQGDRWVVTEYSGNGDTC